MEALKERIAPIIEKFKEFTSKLSKKSKMLISSVALLILFVGAGLIVLNSIKSYSTLFTGLTAQEISEISAKLNEMLVDYKIQGSDTILVLKDQEPKVKASLVSEGYPKNGFTYDIFSNNVNLMSTDAEKLYYMTDQLKAEISATIRMFEGVKDATVQISLGTDKKYIIDENKIDPTASAVVIMQNGGSPTPEQVRGIQRLISRSIPGLQFEKVSVIDGNGRDVSDDSGQSSQQYNATSIKMKIEREVEDEARIKILHLLNPIFGDENIRVAVKSVVDIDKKIKEIINYIPSEGNRGVISSEQTSTTGGNGTGEGGVPGSETNAEENVPVYPGVTTDGNQLIFSDDKAYDYLVSQVTEQIQSEAATYLDTTIAITLNAETLDDENSTNLKRLIANASGISLNTAGEKIEIVAMPFESLPVDNSNVQKSTNTWLIFVLVAVATAVVTGVVVFVLSKRKKSVSASQEANMQEDLMNELEEIKKKNREGIDSIGDFKLGDALETKVGKLQEEIAEFAQTNPAIVAQLIKTWLREEGEEQ